MEAFFAGAGDNSFFLWQWLNLELWAQRVLDRPPVEPAAETPPVVAPPLPIARPRRIESRP